MARTAMLSLLDDDAILKKDNAAVHSENGFTLFGRRFFNTLWYWSARNEKTGLVDGEECYEIPFSELKSISAFDSRNVKHLKEVLREISTTSMEMDLIKKDGEKAWFVRNLFSIVGYDGSKFVYAFTPAIDSRIKNPQMYTRINMLIQMRFKSKYTQAMWENCMRFDGTGSTGFIDVDLWKKLLGVPKSYTEWFRVKQKIINPAIEELNEVTGYLFKTDYEKAGRTIQTMRVRFKAVEEESAAEEPAEPQGELLDVLADFGFEADAARLLVDTHGAEVVEAKIAFTRRYMKKNDVPKPKNFLEKAIAGNWVDGKEVKARLDARDGEKRSKGEGLIGDDALLPPAQRKKKEQEAAYQRYLNERAESELRKLSKEERFRVYKEIEGKVFTLNDSLRQHVERAKDPLVLSDVSVVGEFHKLVVFSEFCKRFLERCKGQELEVLSEQEFVLQQV